MVVSDVAYYLNYRVEGGTLYLSKMEVCFGDCQFFFDIGDRTGSLLEHLLLPKKFLVQRGICNSQEQLLLKKISTEREK